MTVIISQQAESLIKHLKDFDREDFEKWWIELPKITPVGTAYVFQYIDMKEQGVWKDGKFIVPEVKGG